MRGHFLPESYLAGFTDPVLEPGRRSRRAWVCTPKTLRWERRGPRSIAVRRDLYIVSDGKGGKDDTVEKRILCTVEGEFVRIVRDVIRARGAFTKYDRAMFAAFVAFMMVRMPGQLEKLREQIPEAWKVVLTAWRDHLRRNPDEFERLKARAEAETGRPFNITLEEFDPTGVRITTDRAGVVATVFGDISPLAQSVANMEWSFASATPPDYFITSDWPILLLDGTGNSPNDWGRGLLERDARLTLPLSRDIALIAHWNENWPAHYEATSDQVFAFNLCAATRAQDLYVAPKQEFPGSAKIMWKIERDAASREENRSK